MKDWKERFDEEFVKRDMVGNMPIFYNTPFTEIDKIKNFIEQIISERDKEIVNQAINKVLEVTKPSNDQMNIVRALRTITNTN